MIVSKEAIARDAKQAAAAGRHHNEACPYPFGTPEATHWMATYLVEHGRLHPVDTGCPSGTACSLMAGYCAACCS